MRWIMLAVWIGLCFLVAGIGGRWTAPAIPGWYRSLVRPSFAPPNWIFAPVWTLLYLMMAIAAWLIGQSVPSSLRTWGLVLFLLQLALNLAWSWLFFRRHSIAGALADIGLLWTMIGATTLIFSRITPAAAWLMAPYWVWVTYAALLNAGFWRLNRAQQDSA